MQMQFHDNHYSMREIFLVSFYVENTCRRLILQRHEICLYREKTQRKCVFPSAIQLRIPKHPEEGNVRRLWIYSDTHFRCGNTECAYDVTAAARYPKGVEKDRFLNIPSGLEDQIDIG